MPRFGETADKYDKRRGDESDVWIKGFREGETRVRLLEPTSKWITYREHYAGEIKKFVPCSEDADCPACSSPQEKTRTRSRKYAVNTLDGDGRHGVHKINSRLYRVLKGREERLTTINDRDYTVVRSGAGLDTIYDLEPGEKYTIDIDFDMHPIGELLEGAFDAAVAAFNGDDLEDDADEEPAAKPATKKAGPSRIKAPAPAQDDNPLPDEEEPAPKPIARKAAPAKKAAAKPAAKKAEPEEEFVEDGEEETPAADADTIDFNEMSTKEIKAWLDEQGIVYKAADPRSRLIAYADGYEF